MTVKIVNTSTNELPNYSHSTDAGMDVRADLWEIKKDFLFDSWILRRDDDTIEGIVIEPGGRALIPTGIHTSFDSNYECQVRSRSGLALKNGVFVLNSPGTIDAGYRNEYGVILMNVGNDPFIVRQGDRIAQLVFNKIERAELVEVETTENLDSDNRGGGFGSTGV